MTKAGAILGILLLGGCADRTDYSAFADGRRSILARIVSLDARLRELMGEAHPDSTALLRILDTLRTKTRDDAPTKDSLARDAVARTLSEIGIEPVLHPSDSDLVPSLAWERRRAGCVPLALFWIEALHQRGFEARPVLLPGHLAIWIGASRWIEPLRDGISRSESFYDSAFQLEQRPYYRRLRPDSNSILAAMLVQAGLLEWKHKNTRNAESAFQSATKICPGFPEAEGNMGLVLEEIGNAEKSLTHLQIALAGDQLASKARKRLNRLTTTEGAR